MANNIGGFLENDEGPEANYTGNFVTDEDILRMIKDARSKGIVLEAIWEAESSCIAIVPARVGKIMLSWLNDSVYDPLDPLSYLGDELPPDVVEIRKDNQTDQGTK